MSQTSLRESPLSCNPTEGLGLWAWFIGPAKVTLYILKDRGQIKDSVLIACLVYTAQGSALAPQRIQTHLNQEGLHLDFHKRLDKGSSL